MRFLQKILRWLGDVLFDTIAGAELLFLGYSLLKLVRHGPASVYLWWMHL